MKLRLSPVEILRIARRLERDSIRLQSHTDSLPDTPPGSDEWTAKVHLIDAANKMIDAADSIDESLLKATMAKNLSPKD